MENVHIELDMNNECNSDSKKFIKNILEFIKFNFSKKTYIYYIKYIQ